jgi:hypothetical protein
MRCGSRRQKNEIGNGLAFTHVGWVNQKKKVRLTQTTTPAELILRVEKATIDAMAAIVLKSRYTRRNRPRNT